METHLGAAHADIAEQGGPLLLKAKVTPAFSAAMVRCIDVSQALEMLGHNRRARDVLKTAQAISEKTHGATHHHTISIMEEVTRLNVRALQDMVGCAHMRYYIANVLTAHSRFHQTARKRLRRFSFVTTAEALTASASSARGTCTSPV